MALSTHNDLCGPCKNVLDTIRRVGLHTDIVHHLSLEMLRHSAQNACGICSFLLEHLQSSDLQKESDLQDELEKFFPIRCVSDTSAATWQDSFELTLTSYPGGPTNLNLTFTLEAIEELSDDENAYAPSSTTDSPESWELIGRWMKQCTGNHDRCNATFSEPWAPKRLIDVDSEDGRIKLVERDTLPAKKPYATLSHCWGGIAFIMTTTSNISKHLSHGIREEELSKTFNDAIRITRRLGLRYLWIDSLCILQDSPDDWNEEAELMSKVYRHAFVNIAASGAENGTQGCFWDREPQAIRPTVFSVQWSSVAGDESRKYRVVPDSQLWARKLTDQPANTRSWVFQERILSPRMLHFGNEQLFWECRELAACETYHDSLPSSLQRNKHIGIKTLHLGDEVQDDRWPATYTSKNGPESQSLVGRLWTAAMGLFRPTIIQKVTLNSAMKSTSAYQDWDAVVELYSLGRLSYENDKLVALSGLASTILTGDQSAGPDGYLAGIWQSSLPSHLLWVTEKTEALTPRKYEQYVAPSWSWASMEGKISLEWCRNNYSPEDYLAKVEDAEVVGRHGYRFGVVEEGFLRLYGPVASVFWGSSNHTLPAHPHAALITSIFPASSTRQASVPVSPDPSTQPEILFDTVASVPEVLTLLPIVGIMRDSAHEKVTVFGLVLQQQSSGCYTRLGFFYSTRPRVCKILEKIPKQSITII